MNEKGKAAERCEEDGRSGGHDYELRVEGHLDTEWREWFDGMTLDYRLDGSTVLRGHVRDQAALFGLLARIRDSGAPLVDVIRC